MKNSFLYFYKYKQFFQSEYLLKQATRIYFLTDFDNTLIDEEKDK